MVMAVSFCAASIAQMRPITGKVVDKEGKPVSGASIAVKGHQGGTAANADGDFTINAKTGDVLVISSIGHGLKQIKIGSQSSISIVLDNADAVIGEVVVTTGFGVQKQAKEVGYSTATVQSKELLVARPISVANGLTGKVSGLQISTTNNGLFAPTRITLRGNRSLTGNNQPLLVVDGAIFYNDISTISPEDISDVTVLKGASAAAIYGSDASNGVLIVTTKKGVRGKATINFSTTAQIESVAYLPDLQYEYGSNGGEKTVSDFNDLSTYIPYENQSYGPKFNGKLVPLGRPLADGSLLMVPYSPLKNEKKKFFAPALTTQNSFSYQAGDDNSRFFMSLQDVNSKSVMPGDFGRRDIFRVGGSKTAGVFSANYSVSYTYKLKNVTNTATVYQNVMNTPQHVPLTSLKDWQNNKFATLDGFYNDYFDNPYWDIDNRRNISKDNNISANAQFNLKPVKWLNISYRLALTNLGDRYEYKASPQTYSAYSRSDAHVVYSKPDGSGLDTVLESAKYVAAAAGANGIAASYYSSSSNNFLLTSDLSATFDHKLSRDFSIKAVLGTSYDDNKLDATFTGATALAVPVYNVNNVSGIPLKGSGNVEARKFGIFGDATLDFKSYAYVHGSYRTDIDSRFSKDNRLIPYYDVDASFVVSDAFKSITDNNILSFAKIRVAHSLTGNASALAGGSAYIADGAYKTSATYLPSGVTNGGYAQNTNLGNPNIKPEQVVENEVGIELGLFKNKVNLTASIYKQDLTDGIVDASTATSAGSNTALLNAANTTNKGIELDLKTNLIKTKDFSWGYNINYTHSQNKVVSINGDLQSLALSGSISLQDQYGPTVNQNGNAFGEKGQAFPVIETRDWVRDPMGRVVVDPVTGNPSRDPNLKVFGQASPTDILGMTTSFAYKAFTLTATADYRGGNKIFNSIGQYLDFTGISAVTASQGRQRFVFPNSSYSDGNGGYIANTSKTTDDGNFNFWPGLYRSVGGNYISSAAFWKLREISLSYEIPKKVLSFTKIIQRASFSLSGRNLVTLRPKSNVWTDPEFSEGTGNDIGRTSENQTPPTKIYSATLSVTL